MSTPTPEFAVLRERAEQAEARAAEVEAILGAWNAQFGTTQLTHAAERLRVSEARVKELEGLAKAVCSYTPNLPPEKGGNHRYALGMLMGELAALRAANDELDALLASEKASRNAIIAKGAATERANAELAGALRNIIEIVREDGSDERYDRAIAREAEIALDPSLARHAAGEPAKHPDTSGLALIAAERRRQIEAEGWTPEHDDEHANGEMLHAAMAYQMQTDAVTKGVKLPECFRPKFWPWGIEWWKPSTDPVRNLVKAGALLAAEIDRLQRAARATTQQQATIKDSLTVDVAKEVQP